MHLNQINNKIWVQFTSWSENKNVANCHATICRLEWHKYCYAYKVCL
jgi:hypothetical protein